MFKLDESHSEVTGARGRRLREPSTHGPGILLVCLESQLTGGKRQGFQARGAAQPETCEARA
jgi:hypothetical protein